MFTVQLTKALAWKALTEKQHMPSAFVAQSARASGPRDVGSIPHSIREGFLVAFPLAHTQDIP